MPSGPDTAPPDTPQAEPQNTGKAEAEAPTAPPSTAESPTPEIRPPPSQYDLSQPKNTPVMTEEQSLMVQLGRTVLSLGLVVALIYLIAKVVLPRLGGLSTGSARGQLELLERVQLDPKHAIFLVQVSGKHQLLLGGGEGNLRLLSDLGKDERSFGEALEATSNAAVDSTRDDAIQDI